MRPLPRTAPLISHRLSHASCLAGIARTLLRACERRRHQATVGQLEDSACIEEAVTFRMLAINSPVTTTETATKISFTGIHLSGRIALYLHESYRCLRGRAQRSFCEAKRSYAHKRGYRCNLFFDPRNCRGRVCSHATA